MRPSTAEDRCENCRFWVRPKSARWPFDPVDKERGFCHAGPPAPTGSRWAETRFEEWCGAWQEEP